MKKIKQFFRKLNNAGSSIVMVVVSIAFVGIIVGALLSAAGLSYKLKMEDLNSRDNFYYVEQALNEIYAGVGAETVENLQDAYIYTVENMVEFDLISGKYKTKTKEQAQAMFTKEFMALLQRNDFFSVSISDLAKVLASYISNDTVKLDSSKLYVEIKKNDKAEVVGMVIKNVKVVRTQEYDRSVANGAYTQSITTDIEIGEPDFEVLFDASENDDPNIIKYALVADMGVEIFQPETPVTIAGNVYAAADFYNKKYNESTFDTNVSDDDKVFEPSIAYVREEKDGTTKKLSEIYKHGSVTSKTGSDDLTDTGNQLYNKYSTLNDPVLPGQKDYFDGVNQRSMYSGLFIKNSQVSILANSVVVPGTIAVMDKSSLSIYGKSGNKTAESEVWTDNLVLDGYSTKVDEVDTEGVTTTKYSGSEAIIKANMFVKDDTELNAAGSSLQLTGGYYGYGDSTTKDERTFIPTVNVENFQFEVTDSRGDVSTENRGHYNSSAIIVNGEQTTLDLVRTEKIFLAGRTYIELSKDVERMEGQVREGEQVYDTITDTYTYHPYDYDPEQPTVDRTEADKTTSVQDYRMGESISVKSNQLAYIPLTYAGIPTLKKDAKGNSMGYYEATLHTALQDSVLFEKYFPYKVFANKIPCVLQEVSGKKYYYYDFKTAYSLIEQQLSRGVAVYNSQNASNLTSLESLNTYVNWKDQFETPNFFAAQFIEDYTAELNMHRTYVNAVNKDGLTDSAIAEYLTDIGDYEDFEAGTIVLPDAENNPNVSIYSNGAITAKTDTSFSIVRSDDENVLDTLLTNDNTKLFNDGTTFVASSLPSFLESERDYAVSTPQAYQLSNDLEMEYDYMKWNLGHYETRTGLAEELTINNNEQEKAYVKELVESDEYGDASITPINRFLNMDKIVATTKITPNVSGSDSGSTVLDLASGYSVWVDSEDVTVKAKAEDKGIVRGIVVTEGDVYFDENVQDFEGLIVSGGKIYITQKLHTINASAEICRAILRECRLNGDENSKFVLNLFKDFQLAEDEETPTTPGTGDTETKSIDKVEYSDVISFSNWMKNVE